MGLSLSLTKGQNVLYHSFDKAYWVISDLGYDTTSCYFRLNAYPSREAKLKNLNTLENPTIGVGSSGSNVVNCILYTWEAQLAIADIFPNGIPLDPNDQKTAIYEWVKAYTGLPFEDVFEGEE